MTGTQQNTKGETMEYRVMFNGSVLEVTCNVRRAVERREELKAQYGWKAEVWTERNNTPAGWERF